MPISPNPDSAGPDPAAGQPDLGILLLGDTIEADDLASALTDRAGCQLVRDRAAGFATGLASAEAFAETLKARGIRLVVNATNP